MPEIFDTEAKIEGIVADTDTTPGGVAQDVLDLVAIEDITGLNPVSLGSGQEISIDPLSQPISELNFLEDPTFPWTSEHSNSTLI